MGQLTQQQQDMLKAQSEAGDRAGYYATLENAGVIYGALAGGVVREDTVSGRMANAFMAGRAAQLGVEMGPTTALNVSIALMRADYEYRVTQHNGSELGYDKIQEYHENVFTRFQLDRDAWTATAILDVFGKEFKTRGFSAEAGKEFAWNLMMQSGYLGWY